MVTFPLVNKKWVDKTEYYHLGNTPTTGYTPKNTLSITDGCGNERRFGYGISISPTYRNSYNKYEPRMQESSSNSIYITWEELRIMLDFGCFVHFHNIDETKYDKNHSEQIAIGFEDDYKKAIEKLNIKMKVLGLPDGLTSYLKAEYSDSHIEFIRNSLSRNLIYLKSCGSLLKKETYGGINSSLTTDKLKELAKQSVSENPYWVALTVHNPGTDYMDMLTEIYNLYGKAGADNIWAASWDEVYEYQELRNESTITKSTNGQTVTFEVSVPERSNFYFNELSFLVSGIGVSTTVTPLSNNIYGLTHAPKDGNLLININFNSETLKRAEKYTTKYEVTGNQIDKEDGLYFTSMLLPNIATPFIHRLENRINRPNINSISINNNETIAEDKNIKIYINASGGPTNYRIGETSDLSASEWKKYSHEIDYTLSSGYGKKTIYVQISNGAIQSNTVSSTIELIPANGSISRDAVKEYQKKYDKYRVIVEKKIQAK